MRFDGSDQFLDLTIPQAYVLKSYGGYVDPSLWESGINAATLAYTLNAYHTSSDNDNSDSVYGAFNSGINLGAGTSVRAVTITGQQITAAISISGSLLTA